MNTNLIEFVRVDETAACNAHEAEMAANEAATIPCPPPSSTIPCPPPDFDEFPYN